MQYPYYYDMFYPYQSQYPMYPEEQYDEQFMGPQQPMNPPMNPQQPFPQQPMVPTPAPSPDRGVEVPGLMPVEQSYIENILRLNLGKVATIYMTFENNKEWNAKVFRGRLEAAGRDHIIISDPETGRRYLLLMVNLDYITFDEELQYEPPRR